SQGRIDPATKTRVPIALQNVARTGKLRPGFIDLAVGLRAKAQHSVDRSSIKTVFGPVYSRIEFRHQCSDFSRADDPGNDQERQVAQDNAESEPFLGLDEVEIHLSQDQALPIGENDVALLLPPSNAALNNVNALRKLPAENCRYPQD